jgi:APA family basic amino acid/polyamine antiporter
MAFGGTVGVGILRLPASLAASLGNARLIILFWILGGVYALFGAVAVAELAAMMPQAGGFYVYARRAFGRGAGFVVGLSDWLNQVAALAYAAITAAAFLGELWPAAQSEPKLFAVSFVALFTALHWAGIRLSGALTRIISVTVGLMLLAVVVGCFLVPSAPAAAAAPSGPVTTVGMFGAAVAALRSVFVAYDGWYSPIYMAEESTSPGHTLPRSIIGGTLLIAAVYILVNVAILRVLPIPVLAHSTLPAADAAWRRLLGDLHIAVDSHEPHQRCAAHDAPHRACARPRRTAQQERRGGERRRHAALRARRHQRVRHCAHLERQF